MNQTSQYAPRPRGSTEPIALAKQAINALEQRIYDEFGRRIAIGAELEFVLESAKHLTEDEEPLSLKGVPFDPDFRAQLRKPQAQDALFPQSPYVAYSYAEASMLPGYNQYEVVVSHHSTARDENPEEKLHMRGTHLARVLDGLKGDILCNGLDAKAKAGSPYAHVPALRDRAAKVHLNACVEGITNGMHLNVSCTEAGEPYDKEILEYLAETMEEMTAENILLLGTDDDAQERYTHRAHCKKMKVKSDGKPEKGQYIENATPSADSNPHYAILLTLAGVYAGLKNREMTEGYFEADIKKHCPNSNVPPRPIDTAPMAEALFRDPNNSLRAVLNHVQPELGEQFFAAIEKTPPGQEFSRHGTVAEIAR